MKRAPCTQGAGLGFAAGLKPAAMFLELVVHAGIDRATRPWHGDAPGDAGDGHRHALPDIGAAQRQCVAPVEQVVDAHVEADLLPGVAAAQIEQAVTAGFHFVPDIRDAVFGRDKLRLDRVAQASPFLRQGQLRVQRHDVVQVVTRIPVFAAGDIHDAAYDEITIRGRAGGEEMAGKVDANQPGRLVDVLEHVELSVGAAGAAAACVDVVPDMRVVGRDAHAPGFLPGIVPVGGKAQRVRHLRLEVEVADIAVAVADEVVHDRRHGPGGPGVAFVQIGRAGLLREARLVGLRGIRGITRQRGQIPVAVGPAVILAVEAGAIDELVAHAHAAGAVARGIARIHPARLVTQSQQAGPLRREARLPFAEEGVAVAPAVVDVPEGARRHAARPRRRPPVVQAIGLVFTSDPHGVAFGKPDIRADGYAGGLPVGVYWYARGGAVHELLGVAEVHFVPGLLVIDARLQNAPLVLPGVAQIDLIARVVGHVHALVRKILVRNVLAAQLQVEQVILVAQRDRARLVDRPVGGRADYVEGLRMSGPYRERARLEVVARLVVVRLRGRAGIGHAEVFAGHRDGGVGAHGVAVAAVEGADRAAGEDAFAGAGELRSGRLHDESAADAVATDTDRRDAGEYLDGIDPGGIDVGQGRVHVVGAGRAQVHAVDLDAQAIVAQAANRRQARHPAGTLEIEARNVPQQAGRVAGGGMHGLQACRIQRHAVEVGIGGIRRAHDDDGHEWRLWEYGRGIALCGSIVPDRRHGKREGEGEGLSGKQHVLLGVVEILPESK